MLLLLLFKRAEGLKSETESDGKDQAEWAIYGALFILSTMLIIFLFKRNEMKGFTNIILFIQLARWGTLFNYRYSAFYLGFWKRMNELFDPYEFFEITGDPPDMKNSVEMRIETSNFVGNSEELLGVILVVLILFGVSYGCIDNSKGKERSFALLSWLFLVVFTDVMLYCFVQYAHFEGVIGPAISVVLGAIFIMNILFIISGVILASGSTRYYTAEFKGDSIKRLLYYPLVLVTRLTLTALFVFISDYPTLIFTALTALEMLTILYILFLLPFKSARNSVFSIVSLTLELSILSLPLLYEKYPISPETLNITLISLFWALLVLQSVKFLLDLTVKAATGSVNTMKVTPEPSKSIFAKRCEHAVDRTHDLEGQEYIEPLAENVSAFREGEPQIYAKPGLMKPHLLLNANKEHQSTQNSQRPAHSIRSDMNSIFVARQVIPNGH